MIAARVGSRKGYAPGSSVNVTRRDSVAANDLMRGARDASGEREVVEMGESRTPRPKPVTRTHYERVRCLISTDPPPSAGAMIGPAACP